MPQGISYSTVYVGDGDALDETLRSMCGCGYDGTGSKFPILINIPTYK